MDKYSTFRGVSRLWWVPLVTGIVSIGLGIWTLVCPAESLEILAYIFAGCMIGAGVLNLTYACFSSKYVPNWGWALALGIMELIAGIWMFTLPAEAVTMTFIFVVGIWLLFAAINAISEACMLSSHSMAWTIWMVLLLFATVILIVMFLANPIAGGVAVWLWLGLSFLTFGIFRIFLSLKIKSISK